MFATLRDLFTLAHAGRVIARHDGFLTPEQLAELPAPARLALKVGKIGTRKPASTEAAPLAAAMRDLGPSYIKLGQFLATRADLVGPANAADLSGLQDRMAPFGMEEAKAEIAAQLGAPVEELFIEFGPPVAAASIAQVHRAKIRDADGAVRDVAVKVLRPGIEQQFARDLATFYSAARLIERLHPPSRRLRFTDAVQTLDRSVTLEMDLRMEAAAMAEMTANTARDPGFRVPFVDWQRTARRVLTTEWIDAIPLSQVERVREAGIDCEALGDLVIQSFLRHAMRDGFFHADMHPGNLFCDRDGNLVAVDFGIMGRLSPKERRFLAEILYGFITRDYLRISQVHFEAGYVPATQDPAVFAQALRAIGEPIMDRTAEDISMARLLTQLFQVTEQFDMKTQPQLLLLQKTMVVVEGVARQLNPRLNMWTASEPVVRAWMEEKLGPQGRITDAAEGAVTLGRLAAQLPEVLSEAQRTAHMIASMAEGGGLRLDRETTEAIAEAQARHSFWSRAALWVGALALVALALARIL
ncbi:MAG: 2-polyprenylphenol 6-hydroxylase [Hyphomicrobiales bacterium]